MTYGFSLMRAVTLSIALGGVVPVTAVAAEKARLTGLSDVNFGLILGHGDKAISQSVCAYTSSRTERYSVSARGDGPGGTFSLASGGFLLDYDVLWADSSNLQGGTALTANAPSPGFTSTTQQHNCNSGPPATATLTVVLRDEPLRNARAGSYTGVLRLTISPE